MKVPKNRRGGCVTAGKICDMVPSLAWIVRQPATPISQGVGFVGCFWKGTKAPSRLNRYTRDQCICAALRVPGGGGGLKAETLEGLRQHGLRTLSRWGMYAI